MDLESVIHSQRVRERQIPCGSPISESESESHSVVLDSLRPHELYSTQNSPCQNAGVGSISLLQGNLPNPEIEARSPTLQADSLAAKPQGKPL